MRPIRFGVSSSCKNGLSLSLSLVPLAGLSRLGEEHWICTTGTAWSWCRTCSSLRSNRCPCSLLATGITFWRGWSPLTSSRPAWSSHGCRSLFSRPPAFRTSYLGHLLFIINTMQSLSPDINTSWASPLLNQHFSDIIPKLLSPSGLSIPPGFHFPNVQSF